MLQFKKIAQDKLGLSETEALCYELLLIKGKLTAGEVCIYAKLDEETDYETIKGILDNFVQRGLAQKLPKAKGLVDVYTGVPPFEGLINHLNDFSKEIGDLKNQIDTTLQTLKDETKKEVSEIRTNVETIIIDEKAAITNDVFQANNNISQVIESSNSDYNGASEKSKQKVDELINSSKANIGAELEKFENESKGNFANFKEESINQANEVKNTIISKFGGLDEEVKSVISFSKQQFAGTLNSARDKSIADNKSQQEQSLEKINNWKTETYTEFDNLSKTTGDKLDINLSNLKTKNLENSKFLKENITEQKNTFKMNIDNNITTSRNKLSEALTKLDEKTVNNLSELQNGLSQVLEQGKSALNSTLEQQKNSLNDYLIQTSSDLNNSFGEQITSLDSGLNEQKDNFNDKMDEQLNKFLEFGKTFFNETKDQFAGKIQSVIEFIKEKFNEYEAATNAQLNVIKSEVDAKFKEFSGDITEVIENLKGSSLSNIESIGNEVKEKSAQFNDEVKSQQITMLESLENELVKNTNNYSNQLDTDLSQIEIGTEGAFNETKASLEKNITSSKDIINEIISKASTSFNDLANMFEEKINSNTEAAIKDISAKSDEIEGKIIESITKGTQISSEHFSSFIKNIEGPVNSFNEKLGNTVNSSKSSLNANLESLIQSYLETIGSADENFISSVNGLKETLPSQINSMNDGFQGSTDKIGSETLNKIDNLTNQMLKSFDNAVAGVSEPVNKAVEVANNGKSTFENIWSDVKSIELMNAENTWQITSQHTIMTYLEAMVNRTKAHLLIVVPDMSLLPVNAILKTKMMQKITIACKITDKEMANKLVEKGNVDLRSITEMIVSAIGADRDQEEAFYGPYTENPNEMVCTITQQDELIRIIAEMLSSFYRGRSMKYTKS
ncbi:MAG: hypothetical protein ACFFDK_01355 [Promethearchaeota archaeon]